MANCPNCGKKLKLTDYKPECPHCGINICYYKMDERLQNEADLAEEDHAKLQKKIDRLKFSFIGSPLSIIRLVLSLLPIGALMLPICSVTYSGPMIEQTTSKINAISIYNLVSTLNFDSLFTMIGSKLLGTSFTGYAVALIGILLSVVFVLIALFALVAASAPKGNIRNITNNVISIITAVAAVAGFSIFAKNISKVFPEFISAKIEIGIFVYLFSLLLLLVINIVISAKKQPVKYKEVLIGGIPSEEYFKMKEDGVSIDEIHARMDIELDKIAEEEARKAEIREQQRKAKEAEKEAKYPKKN